MPKHCLDRTGYPRREVIRSPATQLHFAETMAALGAKRLRSEPSTYNFQGKDLYNMSYIDILAVGPQDCTISSSVSCRNYSLSTTSKSYDHPGMISNSWDAS